MQTHMHASFGTPHHHVTCCCSWWRSQPRLLNAVEHLENTITFVHARASQNVPHGPSKEEEGKLIECESATMRYESAFQTPPRHYFPFPFPLLRCQPTSDSRPISPTTITPRIATRTPPKEKKQGEEKTIY